MKSLPPLLVNPGRTLHKHLSHSFRAATGNSFSAQTFGHSLTLGHFTNLIRTSLYALGVVVLIAEIEPLKLKYTEGEKESEKKERYRELNRVTLAADEFGLDFLIPARSYRSNLPRQLYSGSGPTVKTKASTSIPAHCRPLGGFVDDVVACFLLYALGGASRQTPSSPWSR